MPRKLTTEEFILRAKEISRSSGLKFDVMSCFMFEDGKLPQAIEKEVLTELNKRYQKPSIKFNGYTECFLDTDQDPVTVYVLEVISKHLSNKLNILKE